ncbi:hypothetical protein [Jiangella mangrovi]|uniref:Sel1 repeat family protein n=1 Tax=Jiangella mangrovi TaxID=1524084 RepID=A0A7W9LNL1_9ACTN|nr:hypothetical protein [Jiangella mangrovi]MBB5790379.1 hypothetical protein [Jiangella mangrovi]
MADERKARSQGGTCARNVPRRRTLGDESERCPRNELSEPGRHSGVVELRVPSLTMCDECFGPFDFRAYGHTEAECRREIATCAELLMQSSASDRAVRVGEGDVVAAEGEAFLQKWLGTSRQSWDRVVVGSPGYTRYVLAMTAAAELGSADAMIDLARNGFAELRRVWMAKAAAAGKPQARMWFSASAAESGDPHTALTWVRSAAESGCEKAMVMFGLLVLDAIRHHRVGEAEAEVLCAIAQTHLVAAMQHADPIAGFALFDLLTECDKEVPDDLATWAIRPWPADPRFERRHFSWFDLLA